MTDIGGPSLLHVTIMIYNQNPYLKHFDFNTFKKLHGEGTSYIHHTFTIHTDGHRDY